MKTLFIQAIIALLTLGRISAQFSLDLHEYRNISAEIDSVKSKFPEENHLYFHWLGMRKPEIPPLFHMPYSYEKIARDPIARLPLPVKVSLELGVSIKDTRIAPVTAAHRMDIEPFFVSSDLLAVCDVNENSKEILSGLIPNLGYKRFIAILNGVACGEVVLPASAKPDRLIIRIFHSQWNSPLDKVDLIMEQFRNIGLQDAVNSTQLESSTLMEPRRFFRLEKILREKNLPPPVSIRVRQPPVQVFIHEPVVFDALVANQGIPSYGFFLSCFLASERKDYPKQFEMQVPASNHDTESHLQWRPATVLKFMESTTLSFNSIRDFSLEPSTPGPLEIPLSGRFFGHLDGRGIIDTTKFTVNVIRLPEERLRKMAEWKSGASPEQVVSVEQLTTEGKDLSLLISRRAGSVARVLRLGEGHAAGQWSMAHDTLSDQMHILLSDTIGTQFYWVSEPQLIGLLVPEKFKDRKPRTLKIDVEGKVKLIQEP